MCIRDSTDTAVRHPDAPFALVAAVIRQIHAVHHVILVAVDVLVAQAADIAVSYTHLIMDIPNVTFKAAGTL